ncbi:MAG TPA: metallophosphoesterase [Gaiellaceae bacterium]|nr:metallophosphoesterase [Gaiellaceae bacterium]
MSVPRGSAPPTRLLHVSDLHFGGRGAPGVEPGLEALIERTAPDLVVATGDLTHRGRPDQHAAAAEFLRSLGPPVLAVPGNHDIPYTFPARFTRTFDEFDRYWETTEPFFRSPTLHVVGLNSVRAWRHQSGGIRDAQLERARALLFEAPDGALRVVALHHHLIGAPWRSRKKPVARRSHVLAELVDSGAELILAGHIHQAAISERHEFEVITGEARGVVVSIAPGLGQPRPNRRGEARGLHVYECTADTIQVGTYVWRDDDWGLTAVRTFARGRKPLRVEPSI